MRQQDAQRQADRPKNIAEQAVDAEMKQPLRDPAKDNREQAKQEPFDPKPNWKLPREVS